MRYFENVVNKLTFDDVLKLDEDVWRLIEEALEKDKYHLKHKHLKTVEREIKK